MHCVGSCEAAYKVFIFPIATQHPTVHGLHFHIEDCQTVTFSESNIEADLAKSQCTELTAFFDFNKELKKQGILVDQMPMCVDVPECFCWDQKTKQWKVSQFCRGNTIGIIHTQPLLSKNAAQL